MEIFDAITPIEQETIEHYIQLYAGAGEMAPLPQVLRVWNKQKRTLYRLLGKKLRVKIPVEIPRNVIYYQRELMAIYDTYSIWNERDRMYFLNNLGVMKDIIHNPFVFEYMKFILTQGYPLEDINVLSKLVFHQNIEKGYITTIHNTEAHHFEKFKSTVKNNMRTVRTIQKVLKAMRFPHMQLFEEWRNRVSDININRDIKTNLVFSIHPIDFMTMSDNACNWTSCMSWREKGSYSAGTIEMMNSNMAILAYLESDTPFNIIFDEEEYNIPNKSWRCLFFINKHILLSGKAYPYSNTDLTKVCLDKLRELAKENLSWTYKYINQEYKDIYPLTQNSYVKEELLSWLSKRSKKNGKERHAIYVYTNGMYNDLIEYHDKYLCCRNYVPKTMRFCLSGPPTCMHCGDYIMEPQDIYNYNDLGKQKVCYKAWCNVYLGKGDD